MNQIASSLSQVTPRRRDTYYVSHAADGTATLLITCNTEVVKVRKDTTYKINEIKES